MLVNLTNHSLSFWNKKQLQAASVYGELMDLPFPEVDATGDEFYISSLADQYAERIFAIGGSEDVVVHLMGEMTFTFALLKRLQAKNYKCIASTSKRIVTNESDGRKNVIFQFDRFREYE